MEIITYPTVMKMFKKLTLGKKLTPNQLKNLEDYVKFKRAGVCQRCGEPLAMSYDTFGLFCRECGWVAK